MRELFLADDNKPLPNIVADANTPPVVLLPGAMAMGGSVATMPPGPPPMGAPGFPMMGGGMPMGPMGPMGPPGQMGGMGDFPMQMPIPPGKRHLSFDLRTESHAMLQVACVLLFPFVPSLKHANKAVACCLALPSFAFGLEYHPAVCAICPIYGIATILPARAVAALAAKQHVSRVTQQRPPSPPPHPYTDVMMGSAGRGFRGRGGGPAFRGRGMGGGRFGGRGMGRMEGRPAEPSGPRDPRSLVSYIDVDAPKVRQVSVLFVHCTCGRPPLLAVLV